MEVKQGVCEVSVATTLNMKNFESIKVSVSFSEPYDPTTPEGRENKYYELLEASQHRLMELAEETKKTMEVIKK